MPVEGERFPNKILATVHGIVLRYYFRNGWQRLFCPQNRRWLETTPTRCDAPARRELEDSLGGATQNTNS
jgi:hypothetical protein